jgi:formate dehydrogenase assembly factor FdhD
MLTFPQQNKRGIMSEPPEKMTSLEVGYSTSEKLISSLIQTHSIQQMNILANSDTQYPINEYPR